MVRAACRAVEGRLCSIGLAAACALLLLLSTGVPALAQAPEARAALPVSPPEAPAPGLEAGVDRLVAAALPPNVDGDASAVWENARPGGGPSVPRGSAPAEAPIGDEARRAPPNPRPALGASGTLYEMLARHHDRQHRASERRVQDQRYLEFVARLGEPARSARLDLDRAELRQTVMPDYDQAIPVYQGFDRIAMRELERTYRRMYRREVRRRVREARFVWQDEVFEADAGLRRSQRVDQRFGLRFPAYWNEHPSAQTEPEVVHYGEQIQVLRLGDFTLRNDLRLRYHERPFSLESVPLLDLAEAGQRAASDADEDRDEERRRRLRGRTGNLANGSIYAIDLNGGIGLRGLSPRLECELTFELLDWRRERAIVRVTVEGSHAPFGRRSSRVSVNLRLRSF